MAHPGRKKGKKPSKQERARAQHRAEHGTTGEAPTAPFVQRAFQTGVERFGEAMVRTHPESNLPAEDDPMYGRYKAQWWVYITRPQPREPRRPLVFQPPGQPLQVGTGAQFTAEWEIIADAGRAPAGSFGSAHRCKRRRLPGAAAEAKEADEADEYYNVKIIDKSRWAVAWDDRPDVSDHTRIEGLFAVFARQWARIRFEVEFYARVYSGATFTHAASPYFLQMYHPPGTPADQIPRARMRHSVYEDADRVYLVTTRCDGADLGSAFAAWVRGESVAKFKGAFKLGKAKPDPTRDPHMLRIAQELIFALGLLKQSHIVHLDLKLSNIMLDKPLELGGHVVIIDMGLAAYVDPVVGGVSSYRNLTGTVGYRAPEQQQPQVSAKDAATGHRSLTLVDHRVDVFAMGRVMRALLGMIHAPQPGKTEDVLAAYDMQHVKNAELKAVILKMTDEEVTERPTVEQLLSRQYWKLWGPPITAADFVAHTLPTFVATAYTAKKGEGFGAGVAGSVVRRGGEMSERDSGGRRRRRGMSDAQYMKHLRRERRELELERAQLRAKFAGLRCLVGEVWGALDAADV